MSSPMPVLPAPIRRLHAALLLALLLALPVSNAAAAPVAMESGPAQVAASDAPEAANRQFVQAMRLIRQADGSFDQQEENTLLREADRLLTEIEQRFPESTIAVQLITN